MTDISRRGQLRYEISTSSPLTEAGKEFSIAVKVTNPFEVPVTIEAATTKLPVEFLDATKERLAEQEAGLRRRLRRLLRDTFPEVKEVKERKRQLAIDTMKEVLRAFPIIGPAIATGATFAEYIRASNLSALATVDTIADSVTTAEIRKVIDAAQGDPNPTERMRQESIRLLEEKVRAVQAQLQSAVVLQPGNSMVQVFTLRTTGSLLFRPSTYRLHIELQYEADGTKQRDVIDYSLSVSASIRTLMAGAALGSAAGFLVRDVLGGGSLALATGTVPWGSYALLLLANVALAVIAVIVFARKKDVQPLLSIEDFWGGVLIGFLAGYSGKGFLQNLIPGPPGS